MSEVTVYKPSWKNVKKYGIYFQYFFEYLKYGDLKSLRASLKYVLTHKLPLVNYKTKSGMGEFLIRKNTTDFQFINYAYEKSIKKYLEHNIDTFDIFLDIGACIGEYSIWLANKGKFCVAVEPVNWEALSNNVRLNSLEEKVKIFPCGVGEKKEKVYFNIPYGVTSSSRLSRSSTNDPNVDIDTLDNIMNTINLSPNGRIIMKIDVEGMEPEAIKGATKFLTACENIRVIYEHFPEDDYRNDKCLMAICNFEIRNLDSVNRIATKIYANQS